MEDSIFNKLNKINVQDKIEKKGKLSYLSWAFAWSELKKLYPNATYRVIKNNDGWNYHTDGRTCWVEVGVTIDDLEHIEMLPVMNYQNKSIPLNAVSSMDINKSIQRAITKAVARHGLGLYIYAGEDMPEESDGDTIVKEPVSMTNLMELSELLKGHDNVMSELLKRAKVKALSELTKLSQQDFDKIVDWCKKKIENK